MVPSERGGWEAGRGRWWRARPMVILGGVFLIVSAGLLLAPGGPIGTQLRAAHPTPDPRFSAIATEQAARWDSPAPVVARVTPSTTPAPVRIATPSVAIRAGTPREASAPPVTPSVRATPDIVERLVGAESALRSGEFATTIDYGEGRRSTTTWRFVLGEGRQPGRIARLIVYSGVTGERRVERIVVGERAWERSGEGPWQPVPFEETAEQQVEALLPGIAAVRPRPLPDDTGDAILVRWYDAARGADIAVSVTGATGIPSRCIRTVRASGIAEIVEYRRWNTPVEVLPPVIP